MKKSRQPKFYPVILAGGSGTRFWPRSRRSRAKQVLALDGKQTMIQQTIARLLPLCAKNNFWIITNGLLSREIARQLPQIPKKQIVSEPAARNTAPAIGLAAFILERMDPTAILGLFPADHVIADNKEFRATLARAAQIAQQPGNIVVMGVQPTRAETGYGYIEAGSALDPQVSRVRRFTEKPDAQKADEFFRAGNYFWNSGMFVWSAQTLTQALREHLPKPAQYLEEIAAAWSTRKFKSKLDRLYPKCENISIDYAVLEPRSAKGENASNIFCLRADFGWNDLGSWAALYEHHAAHAQDPSRNVIDGLASFTADASRNYVYAPSKFVAAVGVNDLVVVETADALLVTTRQRAQDVGKIVKYLNDKKLKDLI